MSLHLAYTVHFFYSFAQTGCLRRWLDRRAGSPGVITSFFCFNALSFSAMPVRRQPLRLLAPLTKKDIEAKKKARHKRLVTYIYKNMQDSELQVFSLQECVARKVQQSLDTYPGIVFKPRISFPFRSTCNMFCIDRTLQEIQVLQAHKLRAYNSPSPTVASAIAIINQSSNRSSNQSNNQSINVNPINQIN